MSEGAEGRVLVRCHAGCETTTILAALGLDESALFEPKGDRKAIVAIYPYHDEAGQVLFEAVRFSPKDFRQRRPDGAGGWIWDLKGVRRVVYHLPHLAGKAAILICEGEKDTDAAWNLDIPATCNPGGAGKWIDDYSRQLVAAGIKRVAIIPDNDDPGRKHAEQIARSLIAVGIEVRIIVLPDVAAKGDLTDYLATHSKDDLLALVRQTQAWTLDTKVPEPPKPLTDFRHTEGRYTWARIPPGIMFELDRIRRDHDALTGELTVRCDFEGMSRTPTGALLTGEFNLSSVRARQERAKVLKDRAKGGPEVDWMGALEEFCERVHEAERRGSPAIRLDEIAVNRTHDTSVTIDGVPILLHHPIIIFGDGGTAKSYLALYLAGRLAQQGQRVLYADWELLPDEHRLRLHRLFGTSKLPLWYVSCDRPLTTEQDRLHKIIRAEGITYLIVDSVAVACEGPPEAAEVTTGYFRAIRSLNVGSAHLAHTNRSEYADKKPFGSSFWHNLARATWFCQRAEENEDPETLTIGLFNRKANLGPLRPATGFTFHFDRDQTVVTAKDVRDCPGFVGQLPLWQRIETAIQQGGPMTLAALADALAAKEDSISRTVRRRPNQFERSMSADGIQRIRLLKGITL